MKNIKYLLIFLVVNLNIIYCNIKMNDTLINLKKLYGNEDIVGKISFINTDIDEIIVQSKDNSFYNTHNLNKEKDIKGSIYLDYRTNLNSKQIILYGHNSNLYDVPFKELNNYIKKDYYEKHKYIEIFDGQTITKYLIFSVNITQSNEHLNIDNSIEHLEKLKTSLFETNVNVSIDDKLLIIQTCYLDKPNTYIIILAKKL